MKFTIKADWVVFPSERREEVYHSAKEGPALWNYFTCMLKIANERFQFLSCAVVDQDASSDVISSNLSFGKHT